MSLIEALGEVKQNVLDGHDMDESMVSEVAMEYGLNRLLLERKIKENGWTNDGLRAAALATCPVRNGAVAVERKINMAITNAARRCGVTREALLAKTRTGMVNGKAYTVLYSRPRGKKWVASAVCLEDGKTYRISSNYLAQIFTNPVGGEAK